MDNLSKFQVSSLSIASVTTLSNPWSHRWYFITRLFIRSNLFVDRFVGMNSKCSLGKQKRTVRPADWTCFFRKKKRKEKKQHLIYYTNSMWAKKLVPGVIWLRGSLTPSIGRMSQLNKRARHSSSGNSQRTPDTRLVYVQSPITWMQPFSPVRLNPMGQCYLLPINRYLTPCSG